MTHLKTKFRTLAAELITSGTETGAFCVSYDKPQRSPYFQGVTHTLAMVLFATIAVAVLFG